VWHLFGVLGFGVAALRMALIGKHRSGRGLGLGQPPGDGFE
jgi:hypothetical protein